MRPFEEMTDERRCEAGAGLHYKSREWNEIHQCGGGWDGAWPEIDRNGRLTGRIVGCEDGYLNVNDEVMIPVDEARAGGWTSEDEGYAEPPPPVMVEVAAADETIRICGGLDDFAGLEHTAIEDACEAYNRAATAALDTAGGRLNPCEPRGRRLLHSQWIGAKWGYQCGAIGTMATTLTDAEKDAIGAAHDAGLTAAKSVIERADAG